jgi:hypothetical protein
MRSSTFQTHVVPLLAAIPELQGILYDVFYSSNTLCIGKEHGALKHPQPPINKFVKRVELIICMRHDDLDYLRKLGRGDFGFEDLIHIDIIIDGISEVLAGDDFAAVEAAVEGMKDHLKDMEFIKIGAKKVNATYEHGDIWVKPSEDSEDLRRSLIGGLSYC